MEFIAHIRERDLVNQTVEDHLLEVKGITEEIGEKIGVRHIAGLAGMLHDFGKFTEEFKNYIWTAVHKPEQALKRGSVDHSTAGGKLLYQMFHKNGNPIEKLLVEIVSNAIISHHSYLKDYLNTELDSDFLRRMHKSDLVEFSLSIDSFFQKVMSKTDFNHYVSKALMELQSYLLKDKNRSIEEKALFLTKYVFSALIDADRTNTRLFEENQPFAKDLDSKDLFKQYYEKVQSKIKSFQQENLTPINLLRNEMSEQCDKFAENPSGIYTLSIPTGGGKTLASLRYALKHAILFNKKRIIYVVPFTTIIEQNAEEVRKILKDDENILEHHSNVIQDDQNDDEMEDGQISISQKVKLAKDNWDSPIIFTTMVQFLNVFYAKGTRNIRRLHNLIDSVIIFDEVQKVPISCVSLFNHSLNFLKHDGKSSILLCTATQPALDFVEHKLAIDQDAEIINHLEKVTEAFKRIDIVDIATKQTFNSEQLTNFIKDKLENITSLLVILNTKAVVKKLYQKLKEQLKDIPVYHLSTSMCPIHRKEILEKVKVHLNNNEKVICISTQLIEAGVDVSFECVIRSLAGLDSIAQAAGRCNRHGEMGIKQVFIIDHIEENLDKLPEIKVGKQETISILKEIAKNPQSFNGNLLSEKAMTRYFQGFYQQFTMKLNYFVPKYKKHLIDLLMVERKNNTELQGYQNKYNNFELILANSYGTAAKYFKVIDQLSRSVIVPFGEGKKIIADLNGQHTIEDLGKLLRKAQQYSISIFQFEENQLIEKNGIEYFLDGKVAVLKEGFYDLEYGLELGGDSELSSIFF